MNKSKIILFTCFLLCTIVSQAQTRKISGTIKQDNEKAVANATITLRTVSDSTLVKGTATDEHGSFVLENVTTGEYKLTISHISFEPYTQRIVIVNDDVEINNIFLLKATASELAEVTVTSQKPLLTRSADKLTLHVEGSVYEKGENALRLFNVIPGVQATSRDIQFRGSESVTVYIDNRRIVLPREQLLAYLRSIPSESIKSYDLKVVPGAENDAQNGGVIININLKSEYKFGLSGNINTGYWYNGENNASGSASLNYRVGKLTMQGSFGYWRQASFYDDKIIQELKPSGIYSTQNEKYLEKYNTINYNAGIDYRLTDKQTIGANYNSFALPRDFSNITTTDIQFLANAEAKSVDSSLFTNKDGRYRYTNQMANAFYRNKLDSLGSKLDIGYSYIYYDIDDPSALETKFLDGTKMEFHPRDSLFAHNTGMSAIHVVNMDLEKYFSNSLVLTAGGKYTTSKTDYTMDYHYGLSDQSPLDTLRSNGFLYNEQILAFYGTVAKSFKYGQIKLGLRAEHTGYDGRSATTAQTIARNRWDFFPSAYVNRKLGENHSLTASYARRINRPGFRQLNPFTFYTSPTNIQEGNPDLLPYYSNNVQLEYLLKNKYSLTVGYQNSEKAFATNFYNMGDVIISKEENISNNNNVFMSVYIPIKLTNWWEFNTNITVRNTTLDVQTTPTVHRTKFSQNMWASSKFKLPGKYFIEIAGNYQRNRFYGIYDDRNSGTVNVFIKKSFFNDRLSTNIELSDPFHLCKPIHEIKTAGFTRNVFRERLDYMRSVGIWLTYNFSSGKKQTNRENINVGGNEARGRL